MIRTIETGTSNDILRTPSQSISQITRDVRKLARDMKATIGPAGGMGLAAPQVGVNIRMILITPPPEYPDTGFTQCHPEQHFIIINPVITEVSDTQVMFEEGCLSLPDFYAEVKRPKSVTFTGLNDKGQPIGGNAYGIFARILQHEIDHLDGILFEDHIPDKQKKQKDPLSQYI